MRLTDAGSLPALLFWRITVPALGVLGIVIVFAVAVLTPRGQSLENRALSGSIYGQAAPLLRLVTAPNLAIVGVAIIMVALIRRQADAAVRAFLVLILSNGVTVALKSFVLSRPDFGGSGAENTFPSGHATAYLSVLFSSVLVLPLAARAVTSVFGAIVCGAVVTDLLRTGAHRLSDTLGAAFLVLTITALVVTAVRIRAPDWSPQRFERAAVTVLGVGLLAALASSVLVLVVAALTRASSNAFLLWGTESFALAAVLGVSLLFLTYLRKTELCTPQVPRSRR